MTGGTFNDPNFRQAGLDRPDRKEALMRPVYLMLAQSQHQADSLNYRAARVRAIRARRSRSRANKSGGL